MYAEKWNCFHCKKPICTVVLLPIRGSSGERLEHAQSICCKFKCTEGCSKCCLQVALFSSNGRDLPLPSPPARTKYGGLREEGSHLSETCVQACQQYSGSHSTVLQCSHHVTSVWSECENGLCSPMHPLPCYTLVPTDEVLDGIVKIAVFLPQYLKAVKL